MKIYWINGFENGNLGMMTRPRGNDWLDDEIRKLKMQGIDVIVSLLEKAEAKELEIDEEDAACYDHGIKFINFPIADCQVPEDEISFAELILKIEKYLEDGKKVVVHCRMGIGRTSMVAAGVLMRKGGEVRDIFHRLSETRTLEVPDTEEQKLWVARQTNMLLQMK